MWLHVTNGHRADYQNMAYVMTHESHGSTLNVANRKPDDIDDQCISINHSEIYCFACIWLVSPQISFSHFAFYATYSPLPAPALWLTACCTTVEISSDYCLFENTWFNLLSGASSSLFYYLDGLYLKGTCLATWLYHYIYTT